MSADWRCSPTLRSFVVTDSAPSSHSGDVLTATADAAAHAAAPADDCPTFEAVYQQHFDFVWRLARRFGAEEGAVDDVVQDVFVVVHRKLGDFEGRSSVRTWLYGIARRVVSDHRKKRSRRRETTIEDAGPVEATAADPEGRAAQSQRLDLLRQLLEELPDEQREVFVLAELEQMSAPEIAELTGAKLNTVYSRLRLARRAFERGLTRMRAREASERGDS